MVKIKTEFSADNLTLFGGYSNIFSFFEKTKVFKKLDKSITIQKRKKIYEKLDYIRILLTMLTFGFTNMNQLSLFKRDAFLLKLLSLQSIPHASNMARFLKRFTFKQTQQVIEVRRELFKKFHKLAFALKKLTIDFDSTTINLCGHQEGAAKGYNDTKRGNKSYQPLLAFIYETKELLHGVLKPGDAHCANGIVEFVKEIVSMLPYGILSVTVRADSGFFSNQFLAYLEKLRFYYIVCVKAYPTILRKIYAIKECAYKQFDDASEIAVFHFRLKTWSIKRKFIVVRTLKARVDPQIELFGAEKYSYKIYVTTLIGDPKKQVRFYQKRGDAENYIKEQKYDMKLDKMMTDSFWANQALFQFKILCYNLLVWFKNIFIGKSERRTTIRTFRERYLLIPAQLIKHARRFTLKLPRDYLYKQKFKEIELKLEYN